MAKTVFKIKWEPSGVKQKIGDLKQEIENAKDDIKKDSLEDARYLGNKIMNNYKNYLTINHYLSRVDDKQDITYVLNEKQNGGYNINLQGKHILYYEYGTGTRGLENPHPNKPVYMNNYGDGRDIISRGARNNGHKLPRWYPYKDNGESRYSNSPIWWSLDKGSYRDIKYTDYVWMHNGIITKGAPSGKFIYYAVQDYHDELRGDGEHIRLSKKSVSISLKKRINTAIHK